MRNLQIPSSFREVLGESQRPWQLIAVLGVGAVAAVVIAMAAPAAWSDLPWWRRAIAFLLVLDIVAGCLANFTCGTNAHYAASAKRRWVFLAIHVHVLVLAWALHESLWPALAVWAYTLAGASIVNRMDHHDSQLFTAGAWMALGLVVGIVAGAGLVPAPLLAVYLLFLMKLVLSFAVDHHGARVYRGAPAR